MIPTAAMPPLPDLPITEVLPALLASLAAGRNVVLIAPPGAGKTTLVPLALLDAPWRNDGRILVLEPRRLATRAAAARMAALLGEPVGQTVGYRTRLDAAVSAATRIEVITEGLLLRRLLSDPGLDGVAAVLLDEVHERSLNSDLALALCRDLQRVLRPEVRLVAMSATAEAARLAVQLGAHVGAPAATVPPAPPAAAPLSAAALPLAAAPLAAARSIAAAPLATAPRSGAAPQLTAAPALGAASLAAVPAVSGPTAAAPVGPTGGQRGGPIGVDVIESTGRMFPVTVTHAIRDVAHVRDLPDAVARAVRTALAEHTGDILAFLPGMAEIRRVQAALDGCGALVLPLHGDLPAAEQDRALRPVEQDLARRIDEQDRALHTTDHDRALHTTDHDRALHTTDHDRPLRATDHDRPLRTQGQRRVVLATSIAETSLTVPGVRIVVDGGWRRAPRLDQSTGLTRLATLRISRAAAEQRAGRAGREAPGVAIRLWTPALHRGLLAFDRPEILEAELSSLVLTCVAWGTRPGALPLLDAPPQGALAAAEALLRELGALDDTGSISAAGRRMAQLGAHPRLAAMLLAASSDAEAALAAVLAALLEERDPLRGASMRTSSGLAKGGPDDRPRVSGTGPHSGLRAGHQAGPPRGSPGVLDASADIALRVAAIIDGDPAADRGVLARIRQAAAQYRRRLRLPADTRPAGDPGRLLAAGFPDRIAQRRGEPGSFRLSGGGGARLPRTDPLANASLLAVAALEMRASAQIRLAAPLDPDALPAALAARVTETVESGFDPVSGGVLSRRRRRLGTLVLSDRTVPADPAETATSLARAIAAAELRPLPWTDAARQIQARVALMRRLEPDAGWPDLSDAGLTAASDTWLAARLIGMSRLADLTQLDLTAALRGLLPWQLASRLERDLPEHLALPGGQAGVDYTQDPPIVSARAQAFYGLDRNPTLADGRVRPVLALLSPAGRPIAVTADLPGFWRGGWADARRDMRGRYPKHPWPANPASE